MCKLKEEEDIYRSYSNYLSKFIHYFNKYCCDEFQSKSAIFAITVHWQKREHCDHDMIGDFSNCVTGFID